MSALARWGGAVGEGGAWARMRALAGAHGPVLLGNSASGPLAERLVWQRQRLRAAKAESANEIARLLASLGEYGLVGGSWRVVCGVWHCISRTAMPPCADGDKKAPCCKWASELSVTLSALASQRRAQLDTPGSLPLHPDDNFKKAIMRTVPMIPSVIKRTTLCRDTLYPTVLAMELRGIQLLR